MYQTIVNVIGVTMLVIFLVVIPAIGVVLAWHRNDDTDYFTNPPAWLIMLGMAVSLFIVLFGLWMAVEDTVRFLFGSPAR